MHERAGNSSSGSARSPGGGFLDRTWVVSPDLLSVIDLDGCFVASNPAWQATLGWSEEELRFTPFVDLVHPEDVARTLSAWDEVRDDQPVLRLENRYRAKSGEWRWLSWVAVLEVDKVHCSARDIQSQKEQARDLARTLADRDRLWRNSQDLLVVLDLRGIFISVSPSASTILGWTADDMVGRSVRDFVIEDDLQVTEKALGQAAHGPLAVTENRYRHRDGGFRWLSWVAAPEGELIFATGRHITAAKEAQQALARTSAERDRIMRNSRDLITVIDMTGTLLSVNPASQKLLGWTADEMLGRRVTDFIHVDHQPPLRGGLLIAERYAEPRIFLNRFLCKGGDYRWISWSTMVDDGLIYSQGRDVTAEREQAAALQAAEECLRQSQKMEAVGQLTGGIAHDFNNLLAGITGSLEIMRRRIAEGRLAETDRYTNAAIGAARRAAALTQRLLAFSRRQTLEPRALDLNRLLADIEDLTRRTVGPAIEFERVAAADLWTTMADANQLENAVLNLCINARDAMPDGGRLRIETANEWLASSETGEPAGLPSAGAHVALSVTDTGSGMSPEVVARACEPFFTTKPLGMGTGLGLSMVYGFVRQSGGRIRITSDPGRGTSVHLHLPRHHGSAAVCEPVNSSSSCQPVQGQGKTVLVIDDEPTVRMVVAELLAEARFSVLTAADGVAGLAVLESTPVVDLLVTDVGLPGGLNGRQVADAARVRRPNMKVLFITGYAEQAVIGNSGDMEPGMAILTKPFAVDVLEAKIRAMLAA